MNTRLLFGLLCLTPTLCFGALSTTTSYFLNVEALTNVTARSAVRGLTGAFTNGIASGASTFASAVFTNNTTSQARFIATSYLESAVGLNITSRGFLTGPADGQFLFLNAAATDFTRFRFGGSTTNFPGLTKATQELQVTDALGGTNVSFSVNGFRARVTTAKTAAYTATAWDFTIPCDTTSAGFTLTLPASPVIGQILNIKKVSTDGNTLTIDGNGNNIDGSATQTTTLTTRPNFQLQFDGDNWLIL